MGEVELSVEAIRERLTGDRFGAELVVVAEAPSTIDLAWEWLREGGPDGGAVVARRQTRGRGRLGRVWESPPGGLWMSVICRPGLPAGAGGRLGLGLAVAAAEAVRAEAGVAVKLKWPNDLLAGGRKLGGVLVEAELAGERIAQAVLSLGLNVNLSPADLSAELRESATSLREQTGGEHELAALAARTLDALGQRWEDLTGSGEGLARLWRQFDALLGREVVVLSGDGPARGRVQGVDSDGRLLLETGMGGRSFAIGEIKTVGVEAP